jgi:hypothetical protein
MHKNPIVKFDDLVKSRQSDGTVKSSRGKARESSGKRHTYKYVGVTKDEAQHNGWPFYKAVKFSLL